MSVTLGPSQSRSASAAAGYNGASAARGYAGSAVPVTGGVDALPLPLPLTRTSDDALDAVLAEYRRRRWQNAAWSAVVAIAVLASLLYAGVLDPHRYRDALPTILTLARDAMPPDFGRWRQWGRPLLETLSMSVSGTLIGLLAAVPLGVLAARNTGPRHVGAAVRLLLNGLRAVPGLIWGVLFVAAVGFGPLPGVLALACHSTGMIGKFCAELLEHVDPAPGNALRSQGVSTLGVLRFAILPQMLPRMMDVTLYRWEHNVRAATTLGVVGAGGLGLEIVTAFHLFEYREASALIVVLLALVTLINLLGARIRAVLLGSNDGSNGA